MMWRIKRLADPDGVLAPGVILKRGPRRPPAQPAVDAADRGGGDDLRRMRDVRTGLPLAEYDHHPAPADPPAARDGPPAGGIASPGGAAGRVRARRDPDLRGRRELRAGLPAGDRHREARQGVSRAGGDRARRAHGRGRRSQLGRRRAGGTDGASGWQPGGPPCRRHDVAGGAEGRRRGAGAAVASRHARAGPGVAAGDEQDGRHGGVHARLHQPDLRRGRRSRRCRRRSSRSRHGRGFPCGSPTTSPATAARRRGAPRDTRRATV